MFTRFRGGCYYVNRNFSVLPSVIFSVEEEVGADDGDANRHNGQDDKHQKHECKAKEKKTDHKNNKKHKNANKHKTQMKKKQKTLKIHKNALKKMELNAMQN